MSENNTVIANKQYMATITSNSEVTEVPVWAPSLDEALDKAEAAYGEVHRLRLRKDVANG
jgi:hypothetical protein